MKRSSISDPDDLIGEILHQSSLSKKELYAAITELQVGGVETVSNSNINTQVCVLITNIRRQFFHVFIVSI